MESYNDRPHDSRSTQRDDRDHNDSEVAVISLTGTIVTLHTEEETSVNENSRASLLLSEGAKALRMTEDAPVLVQETMDASFSARENVDAPLTSNTRERGRSTSSAASRDQKTNWVCKNDSNDNLHTSVLSPRETNNCRNKDTYCLLSYHSRRITLNLPYSLMSYSPEKR